MKRKTILSRSLVAWLFSVPALAVCLLDDYSVPAEYARSDAVVVAKVVAERAVPDGPDPDSIGGTMYRITIHESFRGTLHGTEAVFSENSSGRFPMVKGRTYLLFLYQQGGRLSADNCGNSGLLSKKKQALAAVRALHR